MWFLRFIKFNAVNISEFINKMEKDLEQERIDLTMESTKLREQLAEVEARKVYVNKAIKKLGEF